MVTDNRLTRTTENRIEKLIQQAQRLRSDYGVSTGWQRGPFFDIQTERFALIAVDTGVLRRVDTDQWRWLQGALERARGKFTLAILGHPLYAGGRYQGGTPESYAGEWMAEERPPDIVAKSPGAGETLFAAVHQLLREHQVQVVMAGDTHYLELYQEHYQAGGVPRTMHHFVNGGGGAYMSIGTPLDWPKEPALRDCAFYPRRDFLIDKLDRETPAWKEPLWFWVKNFRAWPFTAESLAGAFLYNRAPYLQSFVEVRVENSKNRVTLVAHGVNGALHWRDLETFGDVRPAGTTADDVVQLILPMCSSRLSKQSGVEVEESAVISLEDIYHRVSATLVESLNVDEADIKPTSTLQEDLGAESIDLLDILFRLEQEFDIEIPRGELFPEAFFEKNPDLVQAGRLTASGLKELARRMPFADLTRIASNPEFGRLSDLFTVDLLARYVQAKIAGTLAAT